MIKCAICGNEYEPFGTASLCPVCSLNPFTTRNVEGRKDDNGKTQYHLLNWKHVEDDAKVLTFGARKYAANNWQKVENPVERYRDALIRHLTAYMAGELIDPESGLPHLAHVRVNASFLQYFSEKTEAE